MVQTESKQLVKGALFLTMAGLVGKVLGASYRIPLQNLTGDVGFFMYQQIYPVLGLVLMLSLYGFPSSIARLQTELTDRGRSLSVRSFHLPVGFILFVVAGSLALLLYLLAPFISESLGDPELVGIYQFAALSFLLLPFTALGRGVFQGELKMHYVAMSQMVEQVVRVGIIIMVAIWFTTTSHSYTFIGKGAVWAAIGGALAAILLLVFGFMKDKPYTTGTGEIDWRYYIKVVIGLGVVVTLNHALLLILQIADTFTLLPNLLKTGLSLQDSMVAKGIFDRGQPLIQLGSVLGSSFALAVMPAISKSRLQTAPSVYKPHIQTALKLSTLLSFAATIGIILLFPEVNTLLFKNDAGDVALRLLMLAIGLSSVAMTMMAIIQGLGYVKRTAVYIAGAFLLKWCLNLLFVPIWGIMGAALATIVALFTLAICVYYTMRQAFKQLVSLERMPLRAMIMAGAGMAIYVACIQFITSYVTISSRLLLAGYVWIVVVTGALLYIKLLLKCHAFTEEERAILPFRRLFKWLEG